jgi:hypothetical protein
MEGAVVIISIITIITLLSISLYDSINILVYGSRACEFPSHQWNTAISALFSSFSGDKSWFYYEKTLCPDSKI